MYVQCNNLLGSDSNFDFAQFILENSDKPCTSDEFRYSENHVQSIAGTNICEVPPVPTLVSGVMYSVSTLIDINVLRRSLNWFLYRKKYVANMVAIKQHIYMPSGNRPSYDEPDLYSLIWNHVATMSLVNTNFLPGRTLEQRLLWNQWHHHNKFRPVSWQVRNPGTRPHWWHHAGWSFRICRCHEIETFFALLAYAILIAGTTSTSTD